MFGNSLPAFPTLLNAGPRTAGVRSVLQPGGVLRLVFSVCVVVVFPVPTVCCELLVVAR